MKAIALAACLLIAGTASAADSPALWRNVDPDNLVLIDTKYGETAVELAPQFAPHHVARLKALIRAHFYDGRHFYRVIEGFVAQGGIGEGTAATGGAKGNDARNSKWPALQEEFDRPDKGLKFTPLGNPDLFAPQVGYVDGFPVGRDPKRGRAWILHCPGTFAFARDNDANTATTEFYIVIGEAPRRLDDQLTAFGRVISGMDFIQKLNRGDPDVDQGVIQDKSKQDEIVRMRIAADIPAARRPSFRVMRTDNEDFAAYVEKKRHPPAAFYHRPVPHNLDICNVPAPERKGA